MKIDLRSFVILSKKVLEFLPLALVHIHLWQISLQNLDASPSNQQYIVNTMEEMPFHA